MALVAHVTIVSRRAADTMGIGIHILGTHGYGWVVILATVSQDDLLIRYRLMYL